MKYFPLIWSTLLRRKVRTVLTLLSILIAFLLFGLLDTVRSTFVSINQNAAGSIRLITISKMNVGKGLPLSLYSAIKNVPGVAKVGYINFMDGTYQSPKNVISIEAHTENNFVDFYPDMEISPAARLAFHRTRTGALAGEELAKKFNWKVGDKIPLQSSVLQKDGSNIWIFDLVGIYRFADPNMKGFNSYLYINADYLDEARESGKGTIGLFILKAVSPADTDWVARAVDAVSVNSDHETRTQTDNILWAGFTRQVGNLGLIVTSIMGAVFFTLIFLAGHTMVRTVRERVSEIATLKTIGFSGLSVLGLVLSESILLLLLGSIAGLAIATVSVVGLHSTIENVLSMPILPVGVSVWLRGLTLAVTIGLVVGGLPALHGMRLRIVDALSQG
jgi:putative ABC transport system permease protein